ARARVGHLIERARVSLAVTTVASRAVRQLPLPCRALGEEASEHTLFVVSAGEAADVRADVRARPRRGGHRAALTAAVAAAHRGAVADARAELVVAALLVVVLDAEPVGARAADGARVPDPARIEVERVP